MRHVHLVLLSIMLLSCSASRSPELHLASSHPRLILSAGDIDLMRINVMSGEEPFASCFRSLMEKCAPAINGGWSSKPYTGTDGMGFYRGGQRDGGMARDLAILYQITGNDSYADAAVDILEKWLMSDTFPGLKMTDGEDGHGNGMLASRGIFPFLYAYDLLMAGGKVPKAVQTAFRKWLRSLVHVIKEGERKWAENDYYDRQYWQNHSAAAAMGLLSIAVTLRDGTLARYALDSPRNGRDILELVQGCILMEGDETYYREPPGFPVHNGEIYDRYRHFSMEGHYGDYVTKPDRGLQYCILTGEMLVMCAEICRNNGFDLYGWTAGGGERIPLVWDHYAQYMITHDCSGSIYEGEERLIVDGNPLVSPAFWELGNARFPCNPRYERVLTVNNRSLNNDLHLLGPVVLTHGRKL